MAERQKHLFEFKALDIADAAAREEDYHEKREAFWLGEYQRAIARLKDTARIDFRESQVTGGARIDVVVDYGDPAAYQRMQEAWNKMNRHRELKVAFSVEEQVYRSQGLCLYQLDGDDVLHYRLGGGRRED